MTAIPTAAADAAKLFVPVLPVAVLQQKCVLSLQQCVCVPAVG
jgi:hypothetical protein